MVVRRIHKTFSTRGSYRFDIKPTHALIIVTSRKVLSTKVMNLPM